MFTDTNYKFHQFIDLAKVLAVIIYKVQRNDERNPNET